MHFEPIFFLRMLLLQWHPVSEGHPIEYAPTTINKLIVRCCSHDLETRPSFTEILNELSGPCSVEIGEGAIFYRNAEKCRQKGPPPGPGDALPEELLVVYASGEESMGRMSISSNGDNHLDALKGVAEPQYITGDIMGSETVSSEEWKGKLRSLSIDKPLFLEESPESGSPTTSISSDFDCHAAISNLPPARKSFDPPGVPLGTALV